MPTDKEFLRSSYDNHGPWDVEGKWGAVPLKGINAGPSAGDETCPTDGNLFKQGGSNSLSKAEAAVGRGMARANLQKRGG